MRGIGKKIVTMVGLLFFLMAYLPESAWSETIITSLTVREKAGITSLNYPLTFGHVFRQGDARGTVTVKVGAVALPTQCDVKTTWVDGSIRHAVISVLLPRVEAGKSLLINLAPGGANADSPALTKEQILATDIGAKVLLADLSGSGYSGNLIADLRATLNSQMSLNYWLRGAVCTEIIVKQKLNNSLTAAWEVRSYPGTPFIRISNSIENVEADYRGNVNYAVSIEKGNSSPAQVYSKPEFTHFALARWRKVFWLGQAPPEVEIRYDINYLISTGHLPNYDTSRIVPESTLSSAYAGWLSSNRDIMGNGVVTKYFPQTGGRQEIGLMPTWTARYLLSMDNRMREIMLNSAEMAAGCPIHYRESNPTKSNFGHIVSIDDRPTVRTATGAWASSYGLSSDNLPLAIGDEKTDWTVDRAHQASFSYVPYLITGDRFFLEELYYWAGWNLSQSSYNKDWGRNYSLGLVRDQIRGEAWAIRNIAHAAVMAPDGTPEKTYFLNKINNNISQWLIDSVQNPLRNMSRDEGYSGGLDLSVAKTTAPWMEDFFLLAICHLADLGFDVNGIIEEHSKFIIERFTNTSFNWYNGAAYRFPTVLNDNSVVSSWSQANALIPEQPTSFPNPDSPDTYRFIALATLSQLGNQPKGRGAYEWLRNKVNSQNLLNHDPTWAIVPKGPAPPKNVR